MKIIIVLALAIQNLDIARGKHVAHVASAHPRAGELAIKTRVSQNSCPEPANT